MLTALLLALAVQAQPLTAESPELRISFEAFKASYDRGEVLVLDTRNEGAYRAGHIPGAESLPLDAVDARIPELKKETRAIVTYCS
jgi:rhodanese-related sulfurtransferase